MVLETMHFALEMNTLVLEMNALRMRVQISATYTHIASDQKLPNRSYVKLTFETVKVTFENGFYPVVEIHKVSRCTRRLLLN